MKRCITTFRPLPNGPRSSQVMNPWMNECWSWILSALQIHDHNFKVLQGVTNVETSCTSDQELRQPQQLPGGQAGLDLLHFDSFQASYPSPKPTHPISNHPIPIQKAPSYQELPQVSWNLLTWLSNLSNSEVSRVDKKWWRECAEPNLGSRS